MRGKSRVASVNASMSVELLLKIFSPKCLENITVFCLFVSSSIQLCVLGLNWSCDVTRSRWLKLKINTFLAVLHIKTKQSVQALNLHTILYMRRKSRGKKIVISKYVGAHCKLR